MGEAGADLLIIGGGLGGVSAALAALRRGLRVILTEPTRWLGGQLTSQLVPLDEHLFIERTGANRSYRELRDGLRDYYRRHYPLTERARADPYLNPGAAWVSPVSVEPRVAVAVIESLLQPYRTAGRLTVLHGYEPVAVSSTGDRIDGVTVQEVAGDRRLDLSAPYVLDATELGDLLALGGVEHVSGRESRAQTGEPGAAETADPTDMQGATWCFVLDHRDGEDHTIDRPADYDRIRALPDHSGGGQPILTFARMLDDGGRPRPTNRLIPNPDDDPAAVDLDHRNMPPAPELWTYRRIAARNQFRPGFLDSDLVIVNWPANDYTGGPLFGVPDAADNWRDCKELSRSLLYWLQTEAPRTDGGTGFPGLRLRPDVAGTEDGFAQYPYIRESRRLLARTTIVEQDVSVALRGDRGAANYPDSVGVGHYFWIDRHPTTGGHHYPGGLPQPFEIPLGALVPRRVRNLLAAAKNLGTTQITNGCYRLHPVEWSVGEAAGETIAYCLDERLEPHQVVDDPARVTALQGRLSQAGVQLRWDPELRWSR
ncbi:FAD-dependent oxidoreductase [Microlunatus sp. GCM10028923]|uniref:FAD-dependent oxidoreductase n=1 Tax=Microlunatus sp. GCM10028923 TaxID=3273400 RepID=UPI003613DB3F